MKKTILVSAFLLAVTNPLLAQENNLDNNKETELKHYMPLYLDFPAEMNVKKGYQEINIAGGYADFKNFEGVRTLIEYDFAPIDKLGFEIEVPFIFVHNKLLDESATENEHITVPEEGGAAEDAMALRIGFNYSFLTLPEAKTTISAGYFNELETSSFQEFRKPLFVANVYNPFIAIAKIWGERFHTMVYTGPAIKQKFKSNETKTQYRFNTILSYRFGKEEKESFIGLECNQTFSAEDQPQMILRPQIQLQLTENFKIGIVAGIPVKTSNELNGSGFLRLIYSL
ncbi:HAEPLYID family protein [Chryseobacterium ginsenosidimutans]|uniref:HAEPLYID family protein n=1 Tax=Chryseobacterium ginsenosidimutans TaxID=687846 RepID=UPI0031E0748E